MNENKNTPDSVRRFEKKWNNAWGRSEWVYVDLETRKIYTRKKFLFLQITEDVVVINDDQLPPDKKKNNGPRGKSF